MSNAPMVELREVTKRFGRFTAVDRVDLVVRAGEFLTLLGPSGCGKTTMLRMMGGFEAPTAGTVHLDGADVTNVPPYRRAVNQVFQSYALFPHLTVRQNIEFGLRMKNIAPANRRERVEASIAMVALDGLEDRRPSQLSGGQRQRVALARAIVNRPKVLLLDEPLSALDASLRGAMQVELKHLQHKLGITFVFVTHDQAEALTMSDRIAVVNAGRIEQIGATDEVYHRPRSKFVASFIGAANILRGEAVGRGEDEAVCMRVDAGLELQLRACDAHALSTGILAAIRSEKIVLSREMQSGPNTFAATVVESIFKGVTREMLVRTAGGTTLKVASTNDARTQFADGEAVWCRIDPAHIVPIEDDAPVA